MQLESIGHNVIHIITNCQIPGESTASYLDHRGGKVVWYHVTMHVGIKMVNIKAFIYKSSVKSKQLHNLTLQIAVRDL